MNNRQRYEAWLRSGAVWRHAMLIAVILAIGGVSAAATEWVERPYHPPIGSRWIIQRDIHKQEARHENGVDSEVKTALKITSELVIEGTTADSYRIAYRRIKSVEEGPNTQYPLRWAAVSALGDIVVHAVTDARGRPLRVEQLEDMRKGLRTMIDRLAASSGNPQVAANLRSMFAGMINGSAEQFAREHLDELPALALGQNAGLKPGEVRRGSVAEATGVGSPMIKKTELLIVKADAASGDERMLLRESYDADSIKRFLMSIAARIGRDPEDMKEMTMSMDARTDIDVVDGMTRAMHRMSTTRNNLMGDTVVITDRKNVTVSPAP